LDAAHIINDTEPLGDPIVPNGLTLCKIHHSAFDVNIIGISPDYQIHVREDILHEIDGPMLKHGIQELNNRKIILPKHRFDYPDRERLEMRYEKFLKVG
jgi:putative restriction endonuclease